jgi:hypothetical protein
VAMSSTLQRRNRPFDRRIGGIDFRPGFRVQLRYQWDLYLQYSIDFIFHSTKLSLNSTKSALDGSRAFPDSNSIPYHGRRDDDCADRQRLVSSVIRGQSARTAISHNLLYSMRSSRL